MNIQYVDEYLLSKQGVLLEYNSELNVYRYLISHRCFAIEMIDSSQRAILLLKLDPKLTQHIRFLYPEMKQDYYMEKIHWNMIDCLSEQISDEIISTWIDMSYSLAYKTLTNSERRKVDESQ